MEPVQNCPSLIILEDDTGIEEESENPNVENHVDIQYWFPNNGNPTCSKKSNNNQPTARQLQSINQSINK
jgi:hypothetical protein